jgi:gas vesicle protein
MPDPLEEIQSSAAKELYIPRAGTFVRLGEIEEFYRAMGTTMEKAMEEIGRSISGVLSKEIQRSMEDVVKGIEESVKTIVEHLRGGTKEVSKEVEKTGREIFSSLERVSDDAIDRALEKYKRLEESARKLKEKWDTDIIPRLQSDEQFKRAMAAYYMEPEIDPNTGRLLVNVPGKGYIPIERVTPEMIKEAASRGLITRSADLNKMAIQNVRQGIDFVAGIVQPIMSPSLQMITTIAPTPMEQIQIGGNVAGGIAQAITMAGIASGNPIVAGIGMVAGTVIPMVTSILEAIERRRVEIEQRGAGFRWAGFGATEAEQIYRQTATMYYPILSKQQIQELEASLMRMGITVQNLSNVLNIGASLMANFGLSMQQSLNLMQFAEQYGIAPYRMQAEMRGVYASAGIGPTTFGPGERTALFQQVAGIAFQSGIGSIGTEEMTDFARNLTVMLAGMEITPESAQALAQRMFLENAAVAGALTGGKLPEDLTPEELARFLYTYVSRFGLLRPELAEPRTIAEQMQLRIAARRLGISPTEARRLAKELSNPRAFIERMVTTTRATERAKELTERIETIRGYLRMPGIVPEAKDWRTRAGKWLFGIGGDDWINFYAQLIKTLESGPESAKKWIYELVTLPDEMLEGLPEEQAVAVHQLRRAIALGSKAKMTGLDVEATEEEAHKAYTEGYFEKFMQERGLAWQTVPPEWRRARELAQQTQDLLGGSWASKSGKEISLTQGETRIKIELAEGATRDLFNIVMEEDKKNKRGKGKTAAGE